ncbi:MAG: type IV pilin protein [Ketobacter sp.]|nr:MAG: type IV pilin protein [Ketobacter sp.]
MMQGSLLKKGKGFTLIELMIVVAIVAILAAVGYPAYDSSVKKTRRTDAKGALMGLAQAMERYHTANNTYVGATVGATGVYPAEAPLDGSKKFYDLKITALDATSYTLQAQPKNGQDADGTLELKNTGAKKWNGNAGWD